MQRVTKDEWVCASGVAGSNCRIGQSSLRRRDSHGGGGSGSGGVAGRSAAAAVQAIIDQQRVDAASQTEWDSEAEEEEPWEEGLPVFAW